jgi:4,5-dihydroxyphthalate decarboxylase
VSQLKITIATGDYDITRPIIDGAVGAAGLDIVGVTMPSPQRHWRMLKYREFDVAELSLGSHCARVARGESDLIGIPVFPHRRFRHGYVYVPGSSQVTRAADLVGKKIGVRSWQTTAGVWLRGILEQYYDLPVSSVQWIAQDGEDVPLALPDGVQLSRVNNGEAVTELCAQGHIDGLIYPEIPRQVLDGDGTLRRLFDDPKTIEQQYYRRTSIFPIMHVVAVRAELVAEFPWLPRTLCEVFDDAKRRAMQRLDNPRTVSLAWLRSLQEEEQALLGPDPWQYGFNRHNIHTLDTFLGYAHAQGLTARRLNAGDLFHPSVIDRIPSYV